MVTRIGLLTPSSNTVLEPVAQALLAGHPDITLHAARFEVTRIALDAVALAQFDMNPMLEAARLLSHAKVHVIVWSGTSAAWLGLERDRELLSAVEKTTSIPASSCVLGYFELFKRFSMRKIGLVTPYADAVQAQIVRNLESEGLAVTAERHLGITDNFSFGMVPSAEVESMVETVAASKPDAIMIICTNLAGAIEAPEWSGRYGVPVLDSVAVSLWASLDRLNRPGNFLLPPLSGP
jgi:maleate isomerase